LLATAIASVLAAAPIARGAGEPAAAAPRKPNIVFILADDLGYGDVGVYGQTKIKTPNIDALAKAGVMFTQAYAACPVCAPSRCSLMTGLHTGHCLIRGNVRINLRPQDRTVAEVLKEAGYDTAATGKWGLGEQHSTGTAVKKGFDFFYGFLNQGHAHNSYPTFLIRNDDRVLLRNVVPNEDAEGKGVASVKLDFAPDLCNNEILSWLDHEPADHPFFAYVASTAPHANDESHTNEVPDLGPYAATDWTDGNKTYAALCTRFDGYVGQIVAKLKERNLYDNTLVIFTSDNGAQQEGGNDPKFFNSSGPFRGIKREMYEGGFREPMIAVWPGHISPGTSTDQIFSFWDFLPTAADLAGAPIPKDIDGISIAPMLRGEPQKEQHEFLYWEFHERGFEQAVRMGDWKAVRHGIDQPLELYNLKSDIGETKNVAAANPEIISKIKAYLATARTDSPDFPIVPAGRRGRGRATAPAQ
jgi:arylsulfatase A-like enzyme